MLNLKSEKINELKVLVVEGSLVTWDIKLNNIDSVCFEFENEKFIDQTNQNYSLSNKIFS